MCLSVFSYFFFIDTATTEIDPDRHTLSRHDALPICRRRPCGRKRRRGRRRCGRQGDGGRRRHEPERQRRAQGSGRQNERGTRIICRSEEHTSELQSLMRISYAVFCLKKKNKKHTTPTKTNKKQKTQRMHSKAT